MILTVQNNKKHLKSSSVWVWWPTHDVLVLKKSNYVIFLPVADDNKPIWMHAEEREESKVGRQHIIQWV